MTRLLILIILILIIMMTGQSLRLFLIKDVIKYSSLQPCCEHLIVCSLLFSCEEGLEGVRAEGLSRKYTMVAPKNLSSFKANYVLVKPAHGREPEQTV